MKKYLYTMLAVLLFVGVASAGLNDRHSDIDLTGNRNGTKIDLPEVPLNQPIINPRGDRGFAYVQEDIEVTGDQPALTKFTFRDTLGNTYRIGEKVGIVELPLEGWTKSASAGYATVSGEQTDLSIGWKSGWDYPYRTGGNVSKAIVFPRLHPLDKGEEDWYREPAVPGDSYYLPGGVYHATDPIPISPILTQFRLPEKYAGDFTIRLLAHQFSPSGGVTTTDRIRIGYEFFSNNFSGQPETLNERQKADRNRDPMESSWGIETYGHWDNNPFTSGEVSVGTLGHMLSPVEVILPLSQSPAMAAYTPTAVTAGRLITVKIYRVREVDVVDDLRILKARAQFTADF